MSAAMPPKMAAAAEVPPLRTSVHPEGVAEPLKQNARPRLKAESTPVGRARSGSMRPLLAG